MLFLSEAEVTETLSEVIDATEWPEDKTQIRRFTHAPGTRDKVWVYDPVSRRSALFKEPKAKTCEHVCEKLSADIGATLGLVMPEVRYARRGDKLGTVIFSFLDDEHPNFEAGGAVLADICPGFNDWDDRAHTYQRLRRVIERYDSSIQDIGLQVHEMLLFDALVGNVDRHVNNWGFVSNSFQYFAPIFDNGSTLIARCDEAKCGHLLRDNMQFDGLVRNCESRIHWDGGNKSEKLRHFDFVERLVRYYSEDVQSVEGRFKGASSSRLVACLESVPDGWLASVQLEVAAKLIETRHHRLIEVLA